MCVTRDELKAPQSLQVRVRDYCFDQPLPQAATAMGLQDVDIAQIGVSRTIGYNAGKPDLLLAVEQPEAQ